MLQPDGRASARKSFVCIGMWIILLGAVVTPQSLYAQCVPPPGGMVAWWPLDETVGPTSNDIAGSVNNFGTWMNSPTPVAGKVGGALSFSGSNYVDVPDDPELNFGTGDFSIDLWIKTTDASGTRTILDKRTGSVPNVTGYVLFLVNGYLGSQIGDGALYGNCLSTGFVADGNWHHAAVTVDRDNPSGWLHYVDGSAVSPIANPSGYSGSLTNNAPFVMARNLLSPTQTFAGTLDEVELFNRVLDPSEVYSIWNADGFGKCKDTCQADGDANNDAVGLTSADLTYLDNFINAYGPAPILLYSCDLNGDGTVDPADLQLYQDYFVYGISVFDPYGGYPVLCPCDPIPAPVPDTVNIFGMEHISGGTACYDTTGSVLTVSRISEEPCDTLVDTSGDTIIVVAPPAKAGGGGPYGSSLSNLEDAGIAWSGDFKHDTTMQATASFQVEAYGFVDGDSNQVIASTVETKQADKCWALAVKAPVTSYTITAYLEGDTVWNQSGLPTGEGWFQIGRIGHTGKAAGSSGGPYGSSLSNLEDAGIISIGWNPGDTEPGDTHVWNWEIQGIVNLAFDKLIIEGDLDEGVDVGYLTHFVHYAMNVPNFTINAESYTVAYRGLTVTNLGNAIIVPVDSTLEVSNIGSSSDDGMDAEADKKDGEWAIVVANPDPSGTLPTGVSLETEFYFATPSQPDSFSMALSMTKAAPNTWDLAIQSAASICSVKAFNNGSSVFSGECTGTTGLGSVEETVKGIHPVGFKGTASGKPAGIMVSSDYDFTGSPDGVQWVCAPLGVYGITIDYLSISTEVFDTSLVGVTHTTICGANGAKSDPISFTILDIQVTPPFMPGDATGDLQINLSDVIYLLNYLFKGGLPPDPLAAGDANCDGVVNLSDVIYLLNYLFKGGPAPAC